MHVTPSGGCSSQTQETGDGRDIKVGTPCAAAAYDTEIDFSRGGKRGKNVTGKRDVMKLLEVMLGEGAGLMKLVFSSNWKLSLDPWTSVS